MIQVQFTDALTNQQASASTNVQIIEHQNNIVFNGAYFFKPGLLYTFTLTVSNIDGSPAAENSEIFVQTILDDNEPLNQTFTLDNAGTIDLEETLPTNTSSFQIFVSQERMFWLILYCTYTHLYDYSRHLMVTQVFRLMFMLWILTKIIIFKLKWTRLSKSPNDFNFTYFWIKLWFFEFHNDFCQFRFKSGAILWCRY